MPRTLDDIVWDGDPAKIANAEHEARLFYARHKEGLPEAVELSAVAGDHRALIRRASRGRRAR